MSKKNRTIVSEEMLGNVAEVPNVVEVPVVETEKKPRKPRSPKSGPTIRFGISKRDILLVWNDLDSFPTIDPREDAPSVLETLNALKRAMQADGTRTPEYSRLNLLQTIRGIREAREKGKTRVEVISRTDESVGRVGWSQLEAAAKNPADRLAEIRRIMEERKAKQAESQAETQS